MTTQEAIEYLELEWSRDEGFFGRLREGKYDPKSFQRFCEMIRSIQVRDDDLLERRFVALIWYAPVFMTWQRERVQEAKEDVVELDRAITRVQNLLDDLLGVP